MRRWTGPPARSRVTRKDAPSLATMLGRARRGMMALMGSRVAATALALLSLAVVAGLVHHWGEPWLRTVARAIFAFGLGWLARVAWRAPASRSERAQLRVRRLLALLSRPDLHAEFALTSPQVGLAVALLDDWTEAVEACAASPGGIPDALSTAVSEVSSAIERARPSLLALADAPVEEVLRSQAWQELCATAAAASARLGGDG